MQSASLHPAVRSARPEAGAALDEPKPTAPQPVGRAGGRSLGARLRALLGKAIDQLELSPLLQRCLGARWLETVRWMEGRAIQVRNRYCLFHLLIISGGVLIPAPISLDLAGSGAEMLEWSAFGLSLVVAISAAFEGFFHYSERWRDHRRIIELLEAEG